MLHHTPAPLVSVIIAAYNQGSLLTRAIDSALAQTYPHVEVIVVNDGSPDPITRATADQYMGRITYIERENGGVAAARNTGIAASQGTLLALLDQDDVWLPHKLAVEVGILQAHPQVVLVHSSYYLIDAAGQRTGLARLPEGEWQPLPGLLLDVPISACTTLFRKSLLADFGPLDPTLSGSDDWDLWLRFAARGYPFYCVGEPLAEYRVHATNVSGDHDLMVRQGLQVLDKFYAQSGIPAVAQAARDHAYFNRHAWAAAGYYGIGQHDKAQRHLQEAARRDPFGVASGRFLQSLIQSQPAPADAEAAIRFMQTALPDRSLPPRPRRKRRAIAHLTLALQQARKQPIQALGNLVRALGSWPPLVADLDLWAALQRRITYGKGGSTALGLLIKQDRPKLSPWYRPSTFQYGGRLSLATLDPTDSHGMMLPLIPPGTRVLETGCANGRFSHVLVEQGCRVVGMELDAAAAQEAATVCEQVIVGNLEDPAIQAAIPDGFDVIVFGDVLEHLVQPWEVLRVVRSRLAPGGAVVISIPNIAHWDVRMGLLGGHFDYQDTGLLDATHLRFFTQRTLWEMLHQTDYRIVRAERSLRLPEWVYRIRLVRRFAPRLVLPVLARLMPNLFTYQFIIKAVPRGGAVE